MIFRVLAASAFLLLLVGCSNLALSRPGRDLEKVKKVQYDEGWNAATTVMKRYFSVVIPDARSGQVVAITRPTTNFGSKARQRVVVEMIDNGEGIYEIEVRAMNQIDTSSAFKLDQKRYENYRWKTVGFDEELETRLVEEIYSEVDGTKTAVDEPAGAAPAASRSRSLPAPRSRSDGSSVVPEIRRTVPRAVNSRRGARSHMAFIHRKATIQDDFIRGIILGDMHFKEGNFEGAEEQFQRAHKKDPTSPVPILARAHARFAMGEFAKAGIDLRTALLAYGKTDTIKMDRRDFYANPETFYGQLVKLESYVKSNDDDANAHFLLGYNYYFSGRPTLARKAFERALDLDGKDKLARQFLNLLGVDPVI